MCIFLLDVNHRESSQPRTKWQHHLFQIYIRWYCKDQVGLAEWCLLLAGKGLRKNLKFLFLVIFSAPLPAFHSCAL